MHLLMKGQRTVQISFELKKWDFQPEIHIIFVYFWRFVFFSIFSRTSLNFNDWVIKPRALGGLQIGVETSLKSIWAHVKFYQE